jgi:hypothetical protein
MRKEKTHMREDTGWEESGMNALKNRNNPLIKG